MSEQIREQISAYLDGELPDGETELLLKRMTRDAELRECFGRYALAAEMVRDPACRPLSRDFAQRVNLAIDAAEGSERPLIDIRSAASVGARHWWRPLAGAAVAAGVAAIAVVALERRADLAAGVAAPSIIAANGAASTAVLTANTSAPSAGLAGQRKEAVSYTVPAVGLPAGSLADESALLPAARLTNYVFAHSKYSSALGQRNVLSGLIAEQPSGPPASGELTPASAALPSNP